MWPTPTVLAWVAARSRTRGERVGRRKSPRHAARMGAFASARPLVWSHVAAKMATVGRMADVDVIVVGAGLAGLVAACELADRRRSVLILDQENGANVGGQAFWSFGGLFFVGSPEQR